jgi:uncharacterized protein
MKLALFFVLSLIFNQAWAFQVPSLQSPVNDYAGVIRPGTESQLNQILKNVRRDTGVQLAVLTVKSLEGEPIESASIKVVDAWQLGSAKEDKGVLLFFAMQERRLRIEVGQGLEGDLTDADSKRIIDQVMVPLLREKRMSDAVVAGSFEILQRAAPTSNIRKYFGENTVRRVGPRTEKRVNWLVIIIWVIVFLIGGRGGFLPLFLLGGMGRRPPYFGGMGWRRFWRRWFWRRRRWI